MQLFNTLSQRVEELAFPSGQVTLYVCGVTPYDTSHLGHARVGVVYDTLRRYLEHRGLRVRYVQNVTDIDEPLFERARRDGVDWRELGRQQTEHYLASLARIGVARPEHYVLATSVIPQMQAVIAELLEQEHAYAAGGSVYYDASSFERYGELAHADYPTLLQMANEMGNNPDDPHKHDPLDFVLWQPSQPDEPSWDSPWGPGRPGWHIECSTMAVEYLGPQIDIHGGGTDLIFPHHSCEIAQAEPATGRSPFVRCWMHTGLVELEGTKMSKSLGNMVFVDDVLARFAPNALRLAILSYPYREPFEYSEAQVVEAQQHADLLAAALSAVSDASGAALDADPFVARFEAVLAEDFDTPAAIMVLCELAGAVVAAERRDVAAAQNALKMMAQVLGCENGGSPRD